MSIFYDPMISKLIVHAADRPSALNGMQSALRDYKVMGVPTNLGLLDRIVSHEDFRAGAVTTAFLDDHGDKLIDELTLDPRAVAIGVLAQRSLDDMNRRMRLAELGPWKASPDPRKFTPLTNAEDAYVVASMGGQPIGVTVTAHTNINGKGDDETNGPWSKVTVNCEGGPMEFILGTAHVVDDDAYDCGVLRVTELRRDEEECCLTVGLSTYHKKNSQVMVLSSNSLGPCAAYEVEIETRKDDWGGTHGGGGGGVPLVVAPMPGRVVRLLVQEGDAVVKGAPVLILEAMKMEHVVVSTGSGRIGALHCAQDSLVQDKQVMVELELDVEDKVA